MKKILKFDSEPLDAVVKIYYDQMGHFYDVYEQNGQVMILEGFGCKNNVTSNFVSDVNEKKQRIYVEVDNPSIKYSNDNGDSVEEPSHSDYRDWKNWIETDGYLLSLKESRLAKGLTQDKMSQIFNVPVETYQAWENGEQEVPADMLLLIKDSLFADDKYYKQRNDGWVTKSKRIIKITEWQKPPLLRWLRKENYATN